MNDRDVVGRISTLTATSDQLQAELGRLELQVILLALAVGTLAILVVYVHTVGIPDA